MATVGVKVVTDLGKAGQCVCVVVVLLWSRGCRQWLIRSVVVGHGWSDTWRLTIEADLEAAWRVKSVNETGLKTL